MSSNKSFINLVFTSQHKAHQLNAIDAIRKKDAQRILRGLLKQHLPK